jgi:hypothetical protein
MALFKYKKEKDIHILVSTSVPAMDILTRTDSQTFVQMAQEQSKSYEVVINGTFNSYNSLSALMGLMPTKEIRPTGPVIQNGKIISSTPGEGKYHLSYNETGNIRTYHCGIGPLPSDSWAGLGGLGGLIYRGIASDAQNEYAPGAPKNAPLKGPVPAEFQPYLRRKGNTMYGVVEDRGIRSGKVAIAFTASAQLIVAVQGDDSDGVSLDDFRDEIVRLGAINGVLLDCSNSACLVYQGKTLVFPSSHKNNSSVIGVGFKA